MKSILIGALNYVLAILFFPVNLRDYMHARSAEARAGEIRDTVSTAKMLYEIPGGEFRPLARHLLDRTHLYYGVAQSKVAPGKLVSVRPEEEEA